MKLAIHIGYFILFAVMTAASAFALFGQGFVEGIGMVSLGYIFILGSIWTIAYVLHLVCAGWKSRLILLFFTLTALCLWFLRGYPIVESFV
ncbi:hypothetical protein D7Z54_25115 [Salibacterium salarium]|uniref:Uncharacterized protein n=1 Tax=Salibacterium salarium TaxID=284579 RepID=A0A428MWU4_9BACI|nr:hypothetical protein [Salibacterium salarium]RSL30643.1 hypothetical protein D7Z54_25115 [Salibacterium salarium]